MKLYELKRGQVFTVDGSEPIIFGHLDGMYSYCWLESDPEKIVYVAAYAEVEVVG